MKFYISKIILWLKSGTQRILEFQPNKINIITGGSNTGKTVILDIIRYCLMNDNVKISESRINENVLWYGLNIWLNDHNYTIARGRLNGSILSKEYFFSSNGEIPRDVSTSISEDELKNILEAEFSISANTVFRYGSRNISAGSKISMQYFMMLNAITANVIENDRDIYFDDLGVDRYKDALYRIFDLALGIETVENLINLERKQDLEYKISKKEKEIQRLELYHSKKDDDQLECIKCAKSYNLIDSKADYNESIIELKKILSLENSAEKDDTKQNKKTTYEREKAVAVAQLKNLNNFQKEFEQYKKNEKKVEDSLLPVEYLRKHDKELLKTSAFDIILNQFSKALNLIKRYNNSKKPIDIQISEEQKKLKNKINELDEKINLLPDDYSSFESERDKYIFIGRLKEKWNQLFEEQDINMSELKAQLSELTEALSKINVDDVEERRNATRMFIEEKIKGYMKDVHPSLDNYNDYIPFFDYKQLALKLKSPNTTQLEHIGSSSNHMFMHLFLYLAIHKAVIANKSPYVPSFLIVDQPSRPYFSSNPDGRDIEEKSDEGKLGKAFLLMDKYISDMNKEKIDFQMIVFEHVREQFFESFSNVHIVAEFNNALVPPSEYEGK